MKNKKAQIATTLAWVVATLVIVFIMTIYLFVVGFMGGKKAFYGEGVEVEIVDSAGTRDHYVLQQDFFAFLNSLVVIDQEEILVRQLIISEPELEKEKFEKFRELSRKFLEENTKKGISWIRIYNLDEEISRYSTGKYKNYGSSLDFLMSPDYPYANSYDDDYCDSEDKNSLLFSVVIPNKKIVMCVKK